MRSLRLIVEESAGIRRVAEPVTAGIPFPKGLLRSVGQLDLHDADGRRVPLQAGTLARWSDGSVKWALLDFQTTDDDVRDREYTIRADAAAPRLVPDSRLDVSEQAGLVRVDTGGAQFELRGGSSFPCASVRCDGADAIDGARSTLVVMDAGGRSHPPTAPRTRAPSGRP